MEANRLFIYYNEEKTVVQIIQPTAQFYQDEKGNTITPSWRGLVDGVTNSSARDGRKNFHSYEVK